MKCWLLLAAATLVLAPIASAQRRGGGGFAGGGMRGGFTSRGPAVSFQHGPGVGFHGPAGGGPLRGGFGPGRFGGYRPYYGNGFYHRRFSYGYGGGYGYPGLYYFPDYWGPEAYDYGTYSYPPADVTYPGYNATYFDQNSQYQQEQIDRLEDEVARLRQQQTEKANPSPADEPQPATPTVLVFQDKHTEEVQNYAVVGETLWILNEQHARKIPLADLDIPASQKANEDRGVDFKLPE